MENQTVQKPQLLFANTTFYNGNKSKIGRNFSSNIEVSFEKGKMPLYQIYYNPGQKNWGLWKCPYIYGAWDKPKFYKDFRTALEYANRLYQEEDLSKMDYEVKTEDYILYSRKAEKGETEVVKEITYFFTIKTRT